MVKAQGSDDSSVASVEANQARLLNELGDTQGALALFERAHSVTAAASQASLQNPEEDAGKLVMNQVCALTRFADISGALALAASSLLFRRALDACRYRRCTRVCSSSMASS